MAQASEETRFPLSHADKGWPSRTQKTTGNREKETRGTKRVTMPNG